MKTHDNPCYGFSLLLIPLVYTVIGIHLCPDAVAVIDYRIASYVYFVLGGGLVMLMAFMSWLLAVAVCYHRDNEWDWGTINATFYVPCLAHLALALAGIPATLALLNTIV